MNMRSSVVQDALQKKSLSREEANASSFAFWQWCNSSEGHPEKYPDEEVIRFVARVKKIFTSDVSKGKILDLGCGSGKNLLAMAESGLSTYGVDWSEPGIKYISQLLKSSGLEAHLALNDFTKDTLSYPCEFFDAVVAIQMFDHLLDHDAKKLLSETRRVLKRDGIVLLSLMSNRTSKKSRVGIPIEGEDSAELVSTGNSAGEIHRFFDHQRMLEMLSPFFLVKNSYLVTATSDQTGEVAETRYFILEKSNDH